MSMTKNSGSLPLDGVPESRNTKAYLDTTKAVGELFKMRMAEFRKSGARPIGIPGQNSQ
jgi:hypothetical protein